MSGGWSSNAWPQEWVEPASDPPQWQLKMSVVIPTFERLDQLEVLLESLTQQTYPSALTEVIVVDDGSDPPLSPSLPDGLNVKVLRQERDGFGLARARNLGAFNATGDVVVFLDADMIPETTWLEAHARPHHHHTPLAGIGPRTHVSRLHVGMDEIRSEIPIQDLLAGDNPEPPQWLLDRWDSTHDGRIGDDIWWGMSGGNFSVTRSLFVDLDGYDEAGFKEWGGEDNDLGYRIYISGAFVVPIHEAMAWHLGPATNDSAEIEERRRRIKIRLASRVAADSLPRTPGITLRVPDIAVEVVNPVGSFEEGITKVGEILSDASAASIRVSVRTNDDSDHVLLADYLKAEPRVVLASPDAAMGMAPITVRWDADNWPQGLAGWLIVNLGEAISAIVRIDGSNGSAVAWSTRVKSQVDSGLLTEAEAFARLDGRAVTWDQMLQELISTSSSDVDEWRRRAALADQRLAEQSNRRAVRVANSLGSLLRARSVAETRQALAAVARAATGKST